MRLLIRYRRSPNSKSQHARLKKSDQGRKGMDLPMFTPPQIAEKLGDVGQGKCRMPMKRFFVLAILAGAFIAFGAQLSIIVGSDATLGFGFTKFIAGAVFSVGLMLVVVAGAELFTGDNLIVISALEKKVRWGEVLKTWIAVYIGNLVGSVFIALLLYWSGLWSMNGNLVGSAALKIAGTKVGLTFVQGLVRGILCNWLVCLAVWMATASKDIIGKLFAVFFPVMAFVASGFEHSVANMFFIPLRHPPQVCSPGCGGNRQDPRRLCRAELGDSLDQEPHSRAHRQHHRRRILRRLYLLVRVLEEGPADCGGKVGPISLAGESASEYDDQGGNHGVG